MRKGSQRTRGVVNKRNEDGTWHRQTDTQKDEKDDMYKTDNTTAPNE